MRTTEKIQIGSYIGPSLENSETWVVCSALWWAIKSFGDPQSARDFRDSRARQGIRTRIAKVTTLVEEVA